MWMCPTPAGNETHTFTFFAFPTYTVSDMEQISAGLIKVIKHFAK